MPAKVSQNGNDFTEIENKKSYQFRMVVLDI
jgi:hypothetical protein